MASSASSAPSPSTQADSPKVIYVMGAGRSGSTILGVTLGNCRDFFYAGELDKWLPYAGTPKPGDAERASFWEQVRGDVPEGASLFGYSTRCLERSSSLFRARKWRNRRRLREPYLRVAEQLYRAVAHRSGANHVVDTSHYPLRARELQRIGGIELYLVFLARDPRSVVASFGTSAVREPTFGVLKTNAYLWLTNLLSLYAFLRQRRERRVFLRYEDFIADPEAVLRRLLEALDSPSALPDLHALKTGVPIEGNRLIDATQVSLQARVSNSSRRSPLTSLLQLPWSVLFSFLRPVLAAGSPLRSARLDRRDGHGGTRTGDDGNG
ncbi:MAG TPA: sulfotransferase [Solirubrobacteraceae bacterium]|jgi:hypothetical protein|nr:sulfotransferase [Solirubrobacteraceae bacterium]